MLKYVQTYFQIQNGPKWPKVAQSGKRWPKVAQTAEVAQSGPNSRSGQTAKVAKQPKWPNVAQIGPK